MFEASRRGIGKIVVVVVLVLMFAIIIGLGGFFASQGPPVTLTTSQTISLESQTSQALSLSSTTQSTCTAGGTITQTLGSPVPPCGCALVEANSDGSLYVSPDPKVGDDVCIQATLNGSSQVNVNITSSAGILVFSDQCVATGGAGPAKADTCLSLWDTAKPDPQGSPIEPGTYLLLAYGSVATIQLEANFTLS